MFRSIVKNQRLVALFLLGVLLFNYPLLALFIGLLAFVVERNR